MLEINDDNFKEEVLESDQLVLVDFFTKWCSPCKRMIPILEQLANDNPQVKVVKIDVEENISTGVKFDISSVPTLIFLKDGSEIKRIVGLQNLMSLQENTNNLLEA